MTVENCLSADALQEKDILHRIFEQNKKPFHKAAFFELIVKQRESDDFWERMPL